MKDLSTLLSLTTAESKEPDPVVIVRLTTSYWYDQDGLSKRQTIRFLKRRCIGHNFLYEDTSYGGANEVIPRIVNLNECKDGLYQVIICHERTHWETPHIVEDYDYKLIPV